VPVLVDAGVNTKLLNDNQKAAKEVAGMATTILTSPCEDVLMLAGPARRVV
jgi:hypothetical protein